MLWPGADDHRAAIASVTADAAAWLAWSDGTACGLCEAALRRDDVNGCSTTPVAFLEGIFVTPDHRRRGIARALIDTMIVWASTRGCVECASDAPIDNAASHSLHRALDFTETERVVFFRRPISAARQDDPSIP